MKTARNQERGVAVLEFSLMLTILTPLLIGIFAYGFKLVEAQQNFQLARDLAHMYSRGVDFTTSANTTEAQDIAGTLGLTSSGNAAVVLSTIQTESSAECLAATGNANCPNLNKPVFTQQIVIGNATTYQSPFGTPTSTGKLSATSGVSNNYSTTVSSTNQANSTWAVATGFTNVMTLTAGSTTYMVEVITNSGFTVSGVTGSPNVYARAIF